MSEFTSMITSQIRPKDSTSKCMGSTSSAEWGLQMNSATFPRKSSSLNYPTLTYGLAWEPRSVSLWLENLLECDVETLQTLVELEWQEGMRSSLKRPCWNYGTPCGAWQSPETTPTDPWKIQLFAGQESPGTPKKTSRGNMAILNAHKNSPCSNTISPTQLFLKLTCATHVPRFCEIARRPKPADATLPSGKSTCLTGKSSLTGPFFRSYVHIIYN